MASERAWGGSRHELVIATVIVHREGVENKVGITVGTKEARGPFAVNGQRSPKVLVLVPGRLKYARGT